MAPICCINGCKNRYSPGSQIKFYKIPSGSRVFQAERRQLWLDAIQKANGSTKKLNQLSRICGAHFISGEASPDNDMPDYVPSVFTCTKQRPKKKRVEWIYRSRKKRRRPANAGTESTSFSGQNAPEMSPPAPVVQEEVELQTEEILAETVYLQTTSNLTTVSPSPLEPVPQGMSPVVLLKSVLLPAGGIFCDLCHQTFNNVSELINHHRLHHEQLSSGPDEAPMSAVASGNLEVLVTTGAMETSKTPATGEVTENREAPAVEAPSIITDEPSFPCNMCDRSFTTSQNLKRHKLLHVKDGRKCPKCSALFCRRHNHNPFQRRVVPVMKSVKDSFSKEEEEVEDSFSKEEEEVEEKKGEGEEKENDVKEEEGEQEEQEHLDCSSTAENIQPNKVEPNKAAEKISQVSSVLQPQRVVPVICVLSLPRIAQIVPKPPILPRQIKTPVVTSAKTPVLPRPSSPTNLNKSVVPKMNLSSLPDVHPELPPSLELFSPHRLTSSLLEVKRNYDYILNRPKITQDPVVKKPSETLLICPGQKKPVQQTAQVKREKIAFDIEIIL